MHAIRCGRPSAHTGPSTTALIAYQDAAERRCQLAAEVGELVGELIASLVAAGWSEHDAREANIPNLSGPEVDQ